MVYNNSSDINPTGIVKADGSGGFSGVTTTQYNVQVGAASNGLTSIAPSATSGVALVSKGAGNNPAFDVVSPAGGGTGTSTIFTQGSVVFADGSGIYVQDNANFFYDDPNNRLGIVTNTPASNLDVKGNVTIGSYGGTNAAPTNGLIVSGRVGIGTNSPGTNNMLQVSPSVGHGISVQDTMNAVDAGNNQHALNSAVTFAPTAGSTISSSFEATAVFAAPVGQTITSAASFHSSPSYTGNAGTISTAYGVWYDGGGASAGTITTAYGGYFAAPVAGTTKVPLFAQSAAVGTTGTAPPSNGLLVNGAIRNSNLTASGAMYADANKDLTSVALTNGQLLVGSTGANPVAATLTAGSGISVTNGAGSITIAATGGGTGITWSEVTGTSQSMAVNTAYIANNASLVTLTLPTTAAVGDIVWVVGKGAGLWRIAQSAGQQIHYGNVDSTSGATGKIDAQNRYDAIQLVCTVANNEFTCTGVSQGNLSVT